MQDPLSEKYYGISPYAFCAGNPVKYLDPDGERQWPVNPTFKGESRRISDGFKTPSRPSHKGIDINIGSGSHDLGAPLLLHTMARSTGSEVLMIMMEGAIEF